MSSERQERRLAAILAADMVGYTRLMEADERGTIARQKAHRAELIDPAITGHKGRIVKTTGDGLLAEFASVVDATDCAAAIQRGMAEREADSPGESRIRYRIGINLGDIVIDGDDILGDGVNVAARLEGIAAPGGICVSANVHDQIKGKLDLIFEDMGEQRLKNIAEPLRVWMWRADGAGDSEPALALPDKPSIAVLPFENMSGDPEQEYFADGMVEEIITSLSRIDWLFVIARNSSFTYKGRAVDIRQVARELGVRYVLEGSVRKAARRVRITGQLIDAATGAHIWADRFDGDLEDIFDLQDRITETVVGAIEPRLRKAEIERSRRKRPENLDAYDLYLRALPHALAFNVDDNTKALALLGKAIALDPGFAPALAYTAWCYEQRIVHRWPSVGESDPETAVRLAREALALDSEDANATALAGFVLTMVARDYDAGLAAVQRALDLNPNTPTVCWMAGWTNVVGGDLDAALPIFERALRLSPADPQTQYVLNGIGMVHLLRGRYREAAETARRSIGLGGDNDVVYWVLAPACGYLGHADEARKAISKLLSLSPGVTTVTDFRAILPFRDEDRLDIVLDGFRKAGLPE